MTHTLPNTEKNSTMLVYTPKNRRKPNNSKKKNCMNKIKRKTKLCPPDIVSFLMMPHSVPYFAYFPL